MLSGFDANSFHIIEQWLQAGSPGSAMPLTPSTIQEESGQSTQALKQYFQFCVPINPNNTHSRSAASKISGAVY